MLVAAALAAGLLVASPTSAGAWATFCDWDPIVLIVTGRNIDDALFARCLAT